MQMVLSSLVAANSFPDISDLDLKDHVLWGTLLAVLALHGLGRFSIDRLLCSRRPWNCSH